MKKKELGTQSSVPRSQKAALRVAPSIDGDQVEVTFCMLAAPADWERFAQAVRDVGKEVGRMLAKRRRL